MGVSPSGFAFARDFQHGETAILLSDQSTTLVTHSNKLLRGLPDFRKGWGG